MTSPCKRKGVSQNDSFAGEQYFKFLIQLKLLLQENYKAFMAVVWVFQSHKDYIFTIRIHTKYVLDTYL